MRVRACLLAGAFLIPLTPVCTGIAAAQTGGIFTVKDVPIDETAESAAAAQTLALAAGQRAAYARLVTRLVPRGRANSVPEATPELLREIVSGIALDAEKTSAVRYLANLTVNFSPDAVRNRFRAAGVGWAETRSKPLVVIPVLITQGTVQLWDRTNVWHEAWRSAPPGDGLIELIVPQGEAGDIATISPDQARSGDPKRLADMAQRYHAGGALLLAATLKPEAGAGHVLEVAINRFGPEGGDRASVRSYAGDDGMSVSDLLRTAVMQLRHDIEEEWKLDNLLRFGERQELVAVAPLSGLADLIRIERVLGAVAEIQSFQLLSLTLAEARLRLRYLGDPAQLEFALAQKDLMLMQGAVDWRLTLKNPG